MANRERGRHDESGMEYGGGCGERTERYNVMKEVEDIHGVEGSVSDERGIRGTRRYHPSSIALPPVLHHPPSILPFSVLPFSVLPLSGIPHPSPSVLRA
eukprot:6111173-Pyramimonas_sp.AAC.1